jgi:phage-related minor tail protein
VSDAHRKLAETQTAVARATNSHTDAVAQLSARLHGQAAASADTFTGHLKAITTTMEDQAAKFGQKYGPALTKVGAALSGLGGIIKLTQAGMEALKGAQAAATVATEAETAAEIGAEVAGAPLLVVLGLIALAVAALIVVGYEIYKHWNIIWTFIKNLVMDVWNWIAKYWPYLLGILLGPIALAAVLIWKNWAKIKADAKEVIDYIVSIWNGLVSWLTGLPGAIWHALTGMWNFISGEANTVYGWVTGVWSSMIGWVAAIPAAISRALSGMWDFVYNQFATVWGWIQSFWGRMWGWITGLPGAVGRALGHMWDSMGQAFRGAIDWVIDIWNSLNFKIGGWHVGPIHVPTVTIGMPHIPHLAEGGLITREGLIYAHAGEAVTPAKDVGRRAPIVHIDNAHFKEELDVEAFMRRVAWTAQAKAM